MTTAHNEQPAPTHEAAAMPDLPSTPQALSMDTLCAQAGYEPANGEPRVTPIVASTTYKYDDADQVAALFDLAAEGHMYSRISNPTVGVLEAKIAALEGGIGAVATSSGQSANLFAVLALATSGDNFVSLANLYGGTHTLFTQTLARMGIECRLVAPDATAQQIAEVIDERTRLVFAETLGNPGLEVLDFERIAGAAHDLGLPLVVDNTLATPILCRPGEHGADVITHSTTKYIDGHATTVGGIVVDAGTFDWASERFPTLIAPDPAYHQMSWTEAFGPAALLAKIRAGLLRDIGATPNAFGAFLTNLGAETLALRMDRHSQNALALAQFLEEHPKVAWVRYPHLPSHPDHALAQRYLPRGGSGVLSFGIVGGADAGKRVINAVRLASLVVHVGDLRTHLLHPASMTHRQLSETDQLAAGVTPDLIRLSVGIEDVADLQADLAQALDQA